MLIRNGEQLNTMEDYFNLTLTLETASFILNTLNFTDSPNNSLISSNITGNQTNLKEIAAENDTNYEEITRMIHVFVRPILIVGGTIGNLLSFYVMQKGSLKEVSTCFYMSILALVDTGNTVRILPLIQTF